MSNITDRQTDIIKAAGRILTSSGVRGLTIKNLAKEMNFSESAIYRHFTGKEEIIIVMLEYIAMEMDERYTKAISKEHTPDGKFTALLKDQFSFYKNHPHFVVAVFSDGLMEESKQINEKILKIMDVKKKHLVSIIMEGQQKGVFTNAVTTEELVQIVMGTSRMQMFKWRLEKFQSDIKHKGDEMIKSVLTLIKAK